MSIFEERRKFSQDRLDKLSTQVGELEYVKRLDPLCIYVTGSFGRLEATQHSDLDLFFVHLGNEKIHRVSRLDKVLVDAELIKLAKRESFPEFSRDGRFLEIHYLEDIQAALGSPEDDYRNYFTARMLLLLESRPLYGAGTYEKVLGDIVETYFRDYKDHASDFRPVFLVNDIQRYWKTLCLNYEHNRNRSLTGDEKVKSQLKNIKLKFSRLMTCYSALACLVARPTIDSAGVLSLVKTAPALRIESLRNDSEERGQLIDSLLGEYQWFLEFAAKPPDEQLAWIAKKENRTEALDRAQAFSGAFYRLIWDASDPENLKYLVV
ncbi:hypothetical protein ACN28I_08520 [Archangium gephyra]|uniref:hypothetical protein n=1 Tax=Archangium gephyra TaxID=48 RepID=UPI003B7753E9